MKLEEKVRLIPRKLISDERGWFLKVITGQEENLPLHTGEVYLTMAYPGQVRGNHYHMKTNEWFTVCQGTAVAVVYDPVSNERMEWILDCKEPITLFVSAGIAHAFQCIGKKGKPMLLIAYADRLYEPDDTIHYSLV
jgi:dTDP-4-dehydrorhamnose 3,5-epimerase-like enzyme